MLQATLDKFTDNKAVLRFADGQELTIEKSKLPKNISTGDQLSVMIKNSKELTREKQQQAKDLLNEILKDSTEK